MYATSIYFISVQISSILYKLSPKVAALKLKLEAFVKDHCHPAEDEYEKHLEHRIGKDRWTMDAVPPVIDRLKTEAKRQGLWNDVLYYQANKNYISAPFMNISVNIIIISNALTFKVFTPVESTVQVAVMILPFTNMT